MAQMKRAAWLLAGVSAIAVTATWQVRAQGGGAQAPAQAAIEPVNEAPNPYTTIEGWAKLPAGREWGSTSAVDIDKDGRSIWVAERCSANSCADSKLSPVMKFSPSGELLTSFGAGTVTAATDGLLLALDADAFLDLIGRRTAVGGRLLNQYDQVPAAPPA